MECAIRADRVTSPAEAFLRQLSKGLWVSDSDRGRLPDDAQIDDYVKLLAWCRLLAEEGIPPYTHAVNHLGEGIWEFKIGTKRLTFYDTPGGGSYWPKPRRTEHLPGDDFWWFPDFDEFVRLGHAFPKRSQRTAPADIRESHHVRREDLAHDAE